jgi:hypothetical protein
MADPHYCFLCQAEHVTLGTASGHAVSTTPDHQIFASPAHESGTVSGFSDFARTAKLVPAADIRVCV